MDYVSKNDRMRQKYQQYKDDVIRSQMDTEILDLDAKRLFVEYNFDALSK